MDRRSFLSTIGIIALAPWAALTASPKELSRPGTWDPRWDILTPEEISRHFIYVPQPTFYTESSCGELKRHFVKTYFTKIPSVAASDWFRPDGSVHESKRRELAASSIAYIKHWFSFYPHVWRGKAEVFGPYVHGARLCDSPVYREYNKPIHAVVIRVGKVVIHL